MSNQEVVAIRLHGRAMGKSNFAWGQYSDGHRRWLVEHHDHVFKAVRAGLNHYVLGNGIKCHVYDAIETDAPNPLVAPPYVEPIPDYLAINKLMMVNLRFIIDGSAAPVCCTFVGPITEVTKIRTGIVTEIYSAELADSVTTDQDGVTIRIPDEMLKNDLKLVTEARVSVERAMRLLRFMSIMPIDVTEIAITPEWRTR